MVVACDDCAKTQKMRKICISDPHCPGTHVDHAGLAHFEVELRRARDAPGQGAPKSGGPWMIFLVDGCRVESKMSPQMALGRRSQSSLGTNTRRCWFSALSRLLAIFPETERHKRSLSRGVWFSPHCAHPLRRISTRTHDT